MPGIEAVRHVQAYQRPLADDRRAVTALEYGIMAAFFCLVLLGIFSRFGSVLTTMYNGVGNGI